LFEPCVADYLSHLALLLLFFIKKGKYIFPAKRGKF